MKKYFLLRYDTERDDPEKMEGFFEKVIEVHRAESIPATFFCTGKAIKARESQFKYFRAETENDPLFDIQDHSFSHIGLGYTEGKSIDELKEDYEKSFALHEKIMGARPIGVSICGTGGKDGKRLKGFDETEKGKQELGMIAELGVRMINSHLSDVDEATEFINYSCVGHPEVMGFPSCYSDTSWYYRKECGDPLEFVFGRIREHAANEKPMPLMLHDWVSWLEASDQELTHVKKITDYARKQGYEMVTHVDCYANSSIWQKK